ncbi:UDP-N-acetylmuramoyl-L-alanine--D-glutamate ligase [Williamsia herbipolensis]|uniref:UDP-N-acetylmuramoyl-L-alanine--D-glutamate ligase n=1 Tax=Williamsia herbipolensis TaxID=1603258 RepID=UPI0038B5A3B8
MGEVSRGGAAAPATLPDLPGLRVVVAGAGTAGASAARFLAAHGAVVTVADGRPAAGAALADAGVAVVSVDAAVADLQADLLVVSPGFRPDSPLVLAARAVRIPIWGEVELAWRVDASGLLGPRRTWVVITGTNGKTTTTSMVEAIVEASPHTVAACGNIGLPVLDALTRTPRVEILAVEMSSFQLHWAPSVVPDAGVVLNIAEDHLDWHGSMDAYVTAKVGALRGPIAVVGADDPVAGALSATTPGARTIGVRVGAPIGDDIGVEAGVLTDRAFTAPGESPRTILPIDDIRPAGPSGIVDAAAAAALCLAVGVDIDAVAVGLAGFVPGRHRGETVATLDGVAFVDDSKATNPHAAHASIDAHERVVLVAGGLLKGAAVDDLFAATADRLAGVVAIGTDRELVASAIARHAPAIPTVTLFTGDDGRVTATPLAPPAVDGLATAPSDGVEAARAAARSAHEADTRRSDEAPAADRVMGAALVAAWSMIESDRAAGGRPDAVLLAPAAASLDMFAGYGVRGDSFARAAVAIGATPAGPSDSSVRP